MDAIKQISALLKQLGAWYFWVSAGGVVIFGGLLGYLLPDSGLLQNYLALNPSLKQLFSVENWWLETLAGACIPMFVLFALQFYTYRLFKDSDLKARVVAALPFLPKIAWLAGKPIMFMLTTGAVFIGLAIRLQTQASNFLHSAAYLGSAGLAIVVIGFVVRYHHASLIAGRAFSQQTEHWAVRLGNLSLAIAIGCWLYADAWAPMRYLLWLKKTIS